LNDFNVSLEVALDVFKFILMFLISDFDFGHLDVFTTFYYKNIFINFWVLVLENESLYDIFDFVIRNSNVPLELLNFWIVFKIFRQVTLNFSFIFD